MALPGINTEHLEHSMQNVTSRIDRLETMISTMIANGTKPQPAVPEETPYDPSYGQPTPQETPYEPNFGLI